MRIFWCIIFFLVCICATCKAQIRVNPIFSDVDSISIEAISDSLSNKDLWFFPDIIGYGPTNGSMYIDKSVPPSLHYDFNWHSHEYDELKTIFSNRNDNLGNANLWFHTKEKNVHSSNLLDPRRFSFFPARFIKIEKRPIIIPPDANRRVGNNRFFYNARKQWGDSITYILLTPSPDTIYGRHYQAALNYKFKGSEIPDTLFIPFTKERATYVFTNAEVIRFENDFREEERVRNDEIADYYQQRYNSLKRRYGDRIADLISTGKVELGFTEEMCSEALDEEPYKIFTFDSDLGPSYGRYYYTKGLKLYFVNGTLVGIQYRENPIKRLK